jgi:hypothetical protein
MADDHLVYINGELVSANRLREQNRIERDIERVEFDLLVIQMSLEQTRERRHAEAYRAIVRARHARPATMARRSAVKLKYRIQTDARR